MKKRRETASPEPESAEVAEARAVVRTFFATFGMRSTSRTERLVETMVRRAVKRRCLRQERALAALALEEAEADVTAWSFFILGKERIGDHPPILLARAAYHACGGPERWPDVVLDYELPAEFVLEMRQAMPEPTPPERPGRMVQQPFETWMPAKALRPRVVERLMAALAIDHRG